MREVFGALDRVEDVLSKQRYLTGSTLTEADIRLYTTLVRFDTVYVGHFKVCHHHNVFVLQGMLLLSFRGFFLFKQLIGAIM